MKTLAISLGERRVGLLEQTDDWEHRFSFDPEWLDSPARPVLGQIFEDRLPYDIVTSGLPCWFTHLLPQGPLRRAMERQLGEDADELDLLQMLGAVGSARRTWSGPAGSRPERSVHRQVR